MSDVFLTGGTGFIGGALTRRLVAEGRRVRALVRDRTGAQMITEWGAEPVLGDVVDPVSLRRGMAGCATVFHVAGVNAFCLRDPAPLFRVNVDGSVEVIRAAAAADVPRVVYTSSAATLGETTGTVGTEDTVHRGGYLTRYEESKHLAERRVLAEAALLGVDVVCVNPSSVQGPGRARGTARILIGFLNGRLRFAVDTTLSLVYIDDCVTGHLLAQQRGTPGERYVLNGAVLSVRDAVALLEGITGMERRVRYVPGWAARLAGALAGAGSRLLRHDPAPFCPEMARALLHGHTYDGSRAMRELGLAYTPVEEWMRRTLEWLQRTGLA